MHRDLVPETNIVKLTNRAPIAHLAIERGLQAIIKESGGCAEHTHGLNRLYQIPIQCNQGVSDYLANAFSDAVEFYGYNVNVKGLTQFRSIQDYFTKVGTENSFEELRYWAIGGSGRRVDPVPYISLPIYRELLWALWCGFLAKSSRHSVK